MTYRDELTKAMTMKNRCWICKEEKPLASFYKDASRANGHGTLCRDCAPAYKKQQWANHYRAHGDEYRKRRLTYYWANRDSQLERQRESRKRNGGRWKANRRTKHKNNPAFNMFATAKMRARRHGLKFNLGLEDIIIPKNCPALGIPLLVGKGRAIANSPTIDRIDNRKGYVRGNIVVVSFRANTIKSDASLAELQSVLRFYRQVSP